MSSCTTTQKITVMGNRGTSIYTPKGKKVGEIGTEGYAKIELESDAYYAYLLSQDAGEELLVPFALDYKECSYVGSSFSKWTGYTLSCLGAGGALLGAIIMAVGGEFVGVPLLLAGFGLSALGIPMGIAGDRRQQQLDHEYKFKYLSTQVTNQNFTFTRPDIKVVDFVASDIEKTDVKNKLVEVAEEKKTSSKSTKSFGSKSTKSFKDYGTTLAGEYVGNGVLSINGNTVERYTDIVVQLRRIDNNKVAVQVVEANGVEFFGEASCYTVKLNSDKSYSLVHDGVSVATIKIDGNNKMAYLHPRVNIDGDIYTLKITANKK